MKEIIHCLYNGGQKRTVEDIIERVRCSKKEIQLDVLMYAIAGNLPDTIPNDYRKLSYKILTEIKTVRYPCVTKAIKGKDDLEPWRLQLIAEHERLSGKAFSYSPYFKASMNPFDFLDEDTWGESSLCYTQTAADLNLQRHKFLRMVNERRAASSCGAAWSEGIAFLSKVQTKEEALPMNFLEVVTRFHLTGPDIVRLQQVYCEWVDLINGGTNGFATNRQMIATNRQMIAPWNAKFIDENDLDFITGELWGKLRSASVNAEVVAWVSESFRGIGYMSGWYAEKRIQLEKDKMNAYLQERGVKERVK